MTAATAKLGLLFLGGLAVGLVVPWSLGTDKAGSRPDVARAAGEPTVTVRCIVEYGDGAPTAAPPGRRRLPRPDDDEFTVPACATPGPVEVRVQPNNQNGASGPDGVTVIFRIKPAGASGDVNPAPPAQPVPGGA